MFNNLFLPLPPLTALLQNLTTTLTETVHHCCSGFVPQHAYPRPLSQHQYDYNNDLRPYYEQVARCTKDEHSPPHHASQIHCSYSPDKC